ncbi:MAG: 50S ribosomal protein L4 [Candidatus Marinimicrobia bacterium]|nr:50S ribosomal protein L4 [Candidatus Neomarinimicrobiota bacterium]|tara:strand:+ start:980 stop:1609 length:630 start_codon:yes stop_codon:yes gene_type:complete
MNLQVYNSNGEVISKVKVADSVFKIKPNKDVIFRAIMSEMTNSRQGTHSTKTRSDVRGGGRKPWRQKGRGVARAGTIRSPIWRSGGITHGPKPKDYNYKLPKKMKKLAKRSVLSQRAGDKEILVIDEILMDRPKTKDLFTLIDRLGIGDKKITFLIDSGNKNVVLSGRNLPNVKVLDAINASTYDLIDAEVLLFEKNGLKKLDSQLVLS